jgi:hypothetical protein
MVVVVVIEDEKEEGKSLHSTVSGIAYWVSRFQRVAEIAIQLQTV